MAGTLKPNESMTEANYTVISGNVTGSPNGLFNGVATNEWNTINVCYWSSSGTYVELEIFNRCNIWRTGSTTWSTHTGRLKIEKYNDSISSYVDVTNKYTQVVTSINEKTWEKTIEDVEKGRYRFSYDTNIRLDSEWFLEMLPLNKTLILSDGEYRKWIEGTPAIVGGNLTPKMTSNTSPSGIVSASSVWSNDYSAWRAFDKEDLERSWITASGQTTGWLSYEFIEPKIVGAYSITPKNFSSGIPQSPKNWTFEAWNGVSWDVLDTQSNVTGWTLSTPKKYAINNTLPYLKYRVNISANNGDAKCTSIGEFEMFEPPTPATSSYWKTVSTALPTTEQFLEHGMDDLSVLDRKLTTLTLPTTEDVGQILESGKIYRATIDLKKIVDLKSISLE